MLSHGWLGHLSVHHRGRQRGGCRARRLLEWPKQGNSGDLYYTGYVITPYLNGVAQPPISVAGGATYYLGSGLTKGASYRFTVALRNSRVVGPPSALSPIVVPT